MSENMMCWICWIIGIGMGVFLENNTWRMTLLFPQGNIRGCT